MLYGHVNLILADNLPSDISSRIPYTLNSDALGEAPDFLSWSGVVGFIVNMIITIYNEIRNLALNLWQAGITLFCGLVTGNVSMVLSAVNKIVNAFVAFVQWAIELIQNTVNSMLSSIIGMIQGGGEKEWMAFSAASTNAAAEYQASGNVSAKTQNALSNVFLGDLFVTLLAIAIVAELILGTLKVVTLGFAFLLDVAITTIIQVMVTYALGATIIKTTQQPSDSLAEDSFLGWLYNLLYLSPKPRDQIDIGYGAFRACFSLVVLIPSLALALGNPGKLALSVITVILGAYALVTGDTFIGTMLLGVSGLTITALILDPFGTLAINPEIRALAGICSGISFAMALAALGI